MILNEDISLHRTIITNHYLINNLFYILYIEKFNKIPTMYNIIKIRKKS